jgi:Tfp pilus assembly protein PilN
MVGLTAVSMGISGWWWYEGRVFQKEAIRLAAATARTKSLIADLNAQMASAGLTLSAEEMTRVRQNATFINQLADKRAFSWAQLLSDLEATVPLAIAISSVKVNFQESTISLNGVSQDLSTLNTFVTNLQKHEAFRKAALVNHHVHEDESAQGGRPAGRSGAHAGNEIQFSLAAQYRLQTGSRE